MSREYSEKKKIILKRIEMGDSRSYNEIAADLELEIWTRNNKGDAYMEKLKKVNPTIQTRPPNH